MTVLLGLLPPSFHIQKDVRQTWDSTIATYRSLKDSTDTVAILKDSPGSNVFQNQLFEPPVEVE